MNRITNSGARGNWAQYALAASSRTRAADLLRMTLQMLALAGIIRCLEGRQIGIQRCLGIDHQFARIGQVHNQIRAGCARAAADLELLGEVAMLDQTCEFHDAAQRELTPATAHFRTAQGGDEIARFTLQARLAPRQQLDLGAQLGLDVTALGFELLRLRPGRLQRCLQRRHQLRELVFAAAAGEQLRREKAHGDADQQRRADQRKFECRKHVCINIGKG